MVTGITAYKRRPPNEKNTTNLNVDMFGIHEVLAIIGFAGNAFGFPGAVVSIFCDVANAVLYFKEGDPLMGAFSLLCAVPGIGDVIGAVRTGTELAKTAKMVRNAALMAQKAYVTVESASTALDLAGDAKIEYAVNGGEMTASIVAKEFGAIALAGIAAASGKSLMKDASSLARLADVRFSTSSRKTADAVSGKSAGKADKVLGGFRSKGKSNAIAGDLTLNSEPYAYFKNIKNRKDIDPNGYIDIVVHGDATTVQITINGKVKNVDHRFIGNMLKHSSEYNGQPIRLLSCNTGILDNGFAQNLANYMNVEVIAPTRYIYGLFRMEHM